MHSHSRENRFIQFKLNLIIWAYIHGQTQSYCCTKLSMSCSAFSVRKFLGDVYDHSFMGGHIIQKWYECSIDDRNHDRYDWVFRSVVENEDLYGHCLCYASVITEQKKCWKLLAQKFDQYWSNFAQQLSTKRNNMQQGVQTDATGNTEQCWELLHGNVASVCTDL